MTVGTAQAVHRLRHELEDPGLNPGGWRILSPRKRPDALRTYPAFNAEGSGWIFVVLKRPEPEAGQSFNPVSRLRTSGAITSIRQHMDRNNCYLFLWRVWDKTGDVHCDGAGQTR